MAAELVYLQVKRGKAVPRIALLDHLGVKHSLTLPHCVTALSLPADEDQLPLPSFLAYSFLA